MFFHNCETGIYIYTYTPAWTYVTFVDILANGQFR